jgi:hypothetical protein
MHLHFSVREMKAKNRQMWLYKLSLRNDKGTIDGVQGMEKNTCHLYIWQGVNIQKTWGILKTQKQRHN